MLGPIAIPDTDANCFDKVDVLQVAGLLEAPAFTIRAFEDPPPAGAGGDWHLVRHNTHQIERHT